MTKKLLVDYIPFEINAQQIQESIARNGKLIVSGILQRANARNQNGRIYPRETLMREAKKYMKERWHGHEYACDTKITKIVEKEEGWRPWKD